MDAWRIIKASRTRGAFTGEGAYLYGGRWNSPGTRVVYVSSTRSLATLEVLVHLAGRASLKYALIQVSFPDEAVETLAGLPADWRSALYKIKICCCQLIFYFSNTP